MRRAGSREDAVNVPGKDLTQRARGRSALREDRSGQAEFTEKGVRKEREGEERRERKREKGEKRNRGTVGMPIWRTVTTGKGDYWAVAVTETPMSFRRARARRSSSVPG
jgi:hypothetical protein